MPRRHLLSLIFLILLGTLASVWLQNSRPLWRDATGSGAAARIAQDRASPDVVSGKGELTIVVFTDYQCPACRRGDPALRSAVERDGNVRMVYKEWPIFGARSERAAAVALAAHRQDIYPAVHEKLMNAPSFDDDSLRSAVETAGGDWNAIQADLADHRKAIADRLAANRSDAFALGLRGTPGYLIGPLVVEGALSEREFLQVFAEARSKL